MTIECPQCGTENLEGSHLCKNCGYPLSWASEATQRDAEEQPDMSVEPGVDEAPPEWATPPQGHEHSAGPDAPFVAPPPAPPPEPIAPGITCSVCGTRNPIERTYCMRCGAILVEAPPLPPKPTRTRPRVPRFAIAGGLGAAAIIAGLLVARPWASNNDTPGPTVTTAEATTTTAPPEPQLVPSADITASASSTGTPGTTATYDAANMLDGDTSTAWNHCNSDQDQGQPCFTTGGVGSVLTFTFNDPIGLARIDIANGYQRFVGDDDRFMQNARIQSGRITTARDEFEFSLPDERTTQTIENEYGVVAQIRIVVDAVYRGDRWQDLAVSEVQFYARPDSPDQGDE